MSEMAIKPVVRNLLIEHKRLSERDDELTAAIASAWRTCAPEGERLRRERKQIRLDRKEVRRQLHSFWSEVLDGFAELIIRTENNNAGEA